MNVFQNLTVWVFCQSINKHLYNIIAVSIAIWRFMVRNVELFDLFAHS